MKTRNSTKICLIISAVIMVLALILTLCGKGINYGIDFAGGLNLQLNMGTAFEQKDVEEALNSIGVKEFTVSTSGEDGSLLQVRVPKLDSEDEIQKLQSSLMESLSDKYPAMDTTTATASYVGPVAGKTLVKNAILSVILASVLMLIYIALRFDFASGVAAVFGLLHDVLIMLSFMVLLRNVIQMNSSFIAAMLTIVGYSINNTIIIFDRIRENKKNAGEELEDVVKVSVKQCLGRTLITTLTTLATIVTLYIMGVDSIREFSLPIIIGILSGVYSANLINGYVWAFIEKRVGKKAKKA